MKLHSPLVKAPSEFRRLVSVFTALAVLILIAGPSDLLSPQWWQAQGAHGWVTLAISASAGIVVGLFLSRDVWNLVSRNNPLWLDLLIGALVLALLGSFVYLRESEVWLWSFAAADALVVSLLVTVVAVTLLTERLKYVRVYAFARYVNFFYVRRDA